MSSHPVARVDSVRGRPKAASFGEATMRRILAENLALERTLKELRLGIDAHAGVVIADRDGLILEVNDRFAEMTLYSRAELIGAPLSLLNSGRHPQDFFAQMWQTVNEGKIWHGEICNQTRSGERFWVLTTIVPLLGSGGTPERFISIETDITKLRTAEERVRRLAFSDILTGLPNRVSMVKHLEQASQRPGTDHRVYLTVSFEDLVSINDAFGHDIGDRTMLAIAQLLKDMMEVGQGRADAAQAPTEIARVGSNAFGLHFAGLSEDLGAAEAAVQRIAKPLLATLNQVIRASLGSAVGADLRVGYVLYSAGDELDGAEIFTRAEIARRRTFSSREIGRPQGFDQAMIDATQDRVRLRFDLQRGLENGDMRLYLQPIVNRDREVRGFEALLRWEDPVRGLVLPGDFIPLAEHTGMIVEIGAWVLDEACRMLARWAKHERTSGYFISVNVSEQQLRQHEFVETVRSAVARNHARPELLRLEMTETLIHRDVDRTVELLRELQRDHISISLDDFGVGYSSLGYLKQLPVQTLKIDRTFVTNVVDNAVDAALIKAMVDMAAALELKVVAEGVETEAQFKRLCELGVGAFQGYYFGRPEPDALDALFTEH